MFGGTKYKRELKKAYRYLRLFRQLKDAHRAIEIRQDMVDVCERWLIKEIKQTKCNDQHIIAIFSVSNCHLLCSHDAKSYKFVRNKQYYPKRQKLPLIYRSAKNKELLCDRHIVDLRHVS